MKNLCAIFLVLCVTFLFALSPLPSLPSEADRISQEDIDDLQEKMESLEKATEEQKKRLAEMEADEAKLQLALGTYGSLAKQYYREIETVEINRAQCEAALQDFTSQIKDLEKQKETLYDNYKLTLRALRETRNASILELIFDSKSLEELLSAIERAKDLAEYKKQILEKMEESFREIEEKQQQLEKELADQTAMGETLVQMKSRVEKQISETEAYLTEIAQEIMIAKQAISDLTETTEETERELTDLIRAYEEQLEKERLAKQSLLWPLDYPTNIRCTSPYGYRYHPLTGTYSFHTGVDLAGPTSGVIMGDNIYAAMDGTVITSVVNRGKTGYGTYVIISHGYSERYKGNVSTLYAHCEEIFVKAGDTVKQGQRIGRVGTTGSSTGPHLHFEVRMNGLTTDPFSYTYLTEIGGEPRDPYTFIRKSY